MDDNLLELLSEVPNDVFFNDQGDPNYNAIFVEVARRIYRLDSTEFMIPSVDFLTHKLPNLTTFQRSVSTERKRRAS